MKAGVSTASLYPLHTEDALREIAQRGTKTAEVFFNSNTEKSGSVFNDIMSTVSGYGMDIVSVHPFSSPMETVFLFSDYDRRVDEIMDNYRRYFEVMNKLGAKIFVLHGALQSAKLERELYAERLLMITQAGYEFGVTVAQENVCYCKSRSIEFLEYLSEQLGDDAHFVLDIKQAVRSGVSPFDIIDALGNKIVHYHISDHKKDADCLPVGDGCFDFGRFVGQLDKLGYGGALIVELYRENYKDYDELIKSAKTMENLLNFQKGLANMA